MQLLTMIVPSLTELQKESGEAGREQINRYTRWITIPLAALQAFAFIRYLNAQGGGGLLGHFSPFQWFLTLLAVVAGTMLLMWIGEIIREMPLPMPYSVIISPIHMSSIVPATTDNKVKNHWNGLKWPSKPPPCAFK